MIYFLCYIKDTSIINYFQIITAYSENTGESTEKSIIIIEFSEVAVYKNYKKCYVSYVMLCYVMRMLTYVML